MTTPTSTTTTTTTTTTTRTGTSDRTRPTDVSARPRCVAAAGAALAHRRVQRRRRFRVPRLDRRPACSARTRSASRPTAPAIPSGIARWRSKSRSDFALPARDHPHRRARESRLSREHHRSLLPLQARAVLAAVGARAGARLCRRRRRQQRRRSRRLSARAAGPRASSASSVRSTTAGLTKADIRELSHEAGLPTWDEPASACLSSRVPYFSEVTEEKLQAIEQSRTGAPRAGLPRAPRPPPRRGARASSSAATRWRARSSRRSPTASIARCARSVSSS